MGRSECNGAQGDTWAALLHYIETAPLVEVVPLDEARLDEVAELLDRGCVVKIPDVLVEDCVVRLVGAGAMRLDQYETVRSAQPDPKVFVAIARAAAGAAETSATKATGTRPHIDGYQFWHSYRSHVVGGIGSMPDVEVLAYPMVTEERSLVLYDNCAAARALRVEQGEALLGALTKSTFTIADKYLRADPALLNPGQLPFLYLDGSTWRFQVGGSVYGTTPAAGYALDLFNTYLARTAIVDHIDPGYAYVTNPARTAHSGVRWPGVDGGTVLVRQLLRYVDIDGAA